MFEPLFSSYMNAAAATALSVGTFVAGVLAGWFSGMRRRRALQRALDRERELRLHLDAISASAGQLHDATRVLGRKLGVPEALEGRAEFLAEYDRRFSELAARLRSTREACQSALDRFDREIAGYADEVEAALRPGSPPGFPSANGTNPRSAGTAGEESVV